MAHLYYGRSTARAGIRDPSARHLLVSVRHFVRLGKSNGFFDGGLFDVVHQPDGSLQRVEARPVAYALRQAQSLLDPDNLPGEAREDEPRPTADPLVDVIRPFENSTFKADNFSYRVLIAGDSLLVELYCLEPGASVPAHRDRSTEHVLTVVAGEARIRIGSRWTTVRQSEIVLVPAGLYYG